MQLTRLGGFKLTLAGVVLGIWLGDSLRGHIDKKTIAKAELNGELKGINYTQSLLPGLPESEDPANKIVWRGNGNASTSNPLVVRLPDVKSPDGNTKFQNNYRLFRPLTEAEIEDFFYKVPSAAHPIN